MYTVNSVEIFNIPKNQKSYGIQNWLFTKGSAFQYDGKSRSERLCVCTVYNAHIDV